MSVTPLPALLGLETGQSNIPDAELREEVINFYQSAAYAFRHGLYKDEQQNRTPTR